MTHRTESLKALFADTDAVELFNKIGKFVTDFEITTCRDDERFPYQKPPADSMNFKTCKSFKIVLNFSGYIFAHKFYVKGFPSESVKNFKEFHDAVFEKHMKPKGFAFVSLLRPIFGKNVQSCK